MSDAREKAVERLAAVLRGASLLDAAQTVADTEAAGRSFLDGEHSWDGWRDRARVLLCELGLVAIDPALVERLRTTHADDRGQVSWQHHGDGGTTDYGIACSDLADSVLAQLRGGR